MIRKTLLILGMVALSGIIVVSACTNNQNPSTNQQSVAKTIQEAKQPQSLWDSKLFDESRFMLNIKLTAQEKKDAKKLARSFTVHMENSELFLHYLLSELHNRNLPIELAALPLVESGFNPRAVSHAGAKGVWQFTKQTGKSYGLKRTGNYDDFYDFIKSTDASLKYLSHLYNELEDWDLAVVAYHQGEFGVKKKVRQAKNRGIKNVNASNIGLSKAAKQYLRYFHAYAYLLEHPSSFGAKRPEVDNKPAFKKVEIAGNLKSMQQVAKLSGANIATLRQLNAGFLSDSLKNSHHNTLLVPTENAERLEQALQLQDSLSSR